LVVPEMAVECGAGSGGESRGGEVVDSRGLAEEWIPEMYEGE